MRKHLGCINTILSAVAIISFVWLIFGYFIRLSVSGFFAMWAFAVSVAALFSLNLYYFLSPPRDEEDDDD